MMMTLPTPYWQSDDGRATLYCGDCLTLLPMLKDKADCVITDPPYGVGFRYDTHDDSREGYAGWCVKWFARLDAPVLAISCGLANIGIWEQIKSPSWVLAWYKPAAMGRCVVGFNNWEPVVLYGKPPRQICDVFRACIVPDDTIDDHPCPKPLAWAMWQVTNLSNDGDLILDPFAGSGTTGVACIQTGRKFIGIELSEKYCAIAARRLAAACCEDGGLFDPKAKHRASLFSEAV